MIENLREKMDERSIEVIESVKNFVSCRLKIRGNVLDLSGQIFEPILVSLNQVDVHKAA